MEKQSSSQSLAVMEVSSDAETSHATPQRSDQVLRAQFRHSRILGGVALVVVIIAPIVTLLQGEGVMIEKFIKGEKSDEQIKALLDYYNSITGSIGAFVAKPVEPFIGLFVATSYLCFATRFTLDRGSVGHWQYLPVLTAAALAFLFSNGLNSLNVQVTPGAFVTRIAAKDLAAAKPLQNDQPLREDGSLSTTWDRAFAESTSNNSVLNTILRSKLLSQQSLKPQCTGIGFDEIFDPISAVPLVVLGFESQPWQVETLTAAVKPTSSLKIPVSLKRASEVPVAARLPSPANITSNLEVIGAQFISTLSLHDGNGVGPQIIDLEGTNKSGNVRVVDTYGWPSSAGNDDGTKNSFLNISLGLWRGVLNHTANASIEHASVEYNRIAFSENITFDAVTIELPVKKTQLNAFGKEQPSALAYSMLVQDYCSREGCVTPTTPTHQSGKEMTIQPRVHVASICVNDDGTEDLTIFYKPHEVSTASCNRTSNNSMLVIGLGIRTDGDLWDQVQDVTTKIWTARFTNLRTVYSITIGRLSWTTEDLTQAFAAECDNEGGCEGLRFKMQPDSNTSDYIIVGMNSLALTGLSQFNLKVPGRTKWRSLVSAAQGNGQQGFDVLLPRHFTQVTANGSALRTTPASKCSTFVDDFINSVEKNHLYMETSLQTSYTAAFYFLFQNAVQRKIFTSPTTNNFNTVTPHLAFVGNQQVMNVQVSIPTTSAVISLIGCLLLMLASLGILLHAKRSEHVLQECASAEIVTEAMMNSIKFPPLLLTMALEQRNEQDGEDALQENSKFSLQKLHVQSVILRHNEEGNKRSFHIDSEIEV